MKQEAENADTLDEGISCIFRMVTDFTKRYQGVWRDYLVHTQFAEKVHAHRPVILREISAMLRSLFQKTHCRYDDALPEFMAGAIYTLAVETVEGRGSFEQFERICRSAASCLTRHD